jgi:hypothetical protein
VHHLFSHSPAQCAELHAFQAFQRRWKQLIGGVTLLLAFSRGPALAASINAVGSCTMLFAIQSANTDTAIVGCVDDTATDILVLQGRIVASIAASPPITSTITLN